VKDEHGEPMGQQFQRWIRMIFPKALPDQTRQFERRYARTTGKRKKGALWSRHPHSRICLSL